MKLTKAQTEALAHEVIDKIRKRNLELKKTFKETLTKEDLKSLAKLNKAMDLLIEVESELDIRINLSNGYSGYRVSSQTDRENYLERVKELVSELRTSSKLSRVPHKDEVARQITLHTIGEEINIQELIDNLVKEFSKNND